MPNVFDDILNTKNPTPQTNGSGGNIFDDIVGNSSSQQKTTPSFQQAIDTLPETLPKKETLGDKIKKGVASVFFPVITPIVSAVSKTKFGQDVKDKAGQAEQFVWDKTLNTESGRKITNIASESSRGSRLLMATPEAFSKTIGKILTGQPSDILEDYDKAIKRWDSASADEQNGFVENVARGVFDSGAQSGVGVLLNLIPGVGNVASGAFFTAISAEDQQQQQGKVTSTTKLGIDVLLDKMLGGAVEGMLKKPATELAKQGFKQVAKNVGTGVATEGGTEVAQSFLKYADSYARAKTPEEKQKVIDDTKNYVKNGGLLMEFTVGGVSGGLITGAASAVNTPLKPVKSILPIDDKDFTPEQNKMRTSIRNSIQEDIDAGKPREQVVQELIEGTKMPIEIAQQIVDEVSTGGVSIIATETVPIEPGVPTKESINAIAQEIKTKPQPTARPEVKKAVNDIAAKFNKKVEKTSEESLQEEAKKYKSAEEFVKAQQTKSPDYAIGGGSGHTAPYRDDYNAPAHDLTKIYPKDVYEKGAQFYGSGYKNLDTEAMSILKNIKDNPDAEVTIYRAVPKGKGITSFNKGDWVTLTKGYAKEHGISNLNGKYEILSKKVKADEIFTDANSLQEFGYDPRGKTKQELTDIYNKANDIEPKFNEKGRTKLPEVPAEPKRVTRYKDRLKLRGADPVLVDMIITPGDDTAYGVSVGGHLLFEKVVEKYTEDHEMVHLIFDNLNKMALFKKFDKETLFSEARDIYGEDLSDDQIEENLAKDFQQYVSDREAGKPSTFFDTILDFFRRLYASFKRIFRNDADIKEFYRVIFEGKAKEETIIETNDNLDTFISNAKKYGVADFGIQDGIKFNKKSEDVNQIRSMIDRTQQSIDEFNKNPEAYIKAYGPDRVNQRNAQLIALKDRLQQAEQKQRGPKNQMIETGNKLEDARRALARVEERVGLTETEQEEANQLYTEVLFEEAQQINQEALDIFATKENKEEFKNEVNQERLYQEIAKEALDYNKAKNLSKFARNGVLGEVLGGPDVKGRWAREGDQIAQEFGFDTSEEARDAYEKYAIRKKAFINDKKELSQKVKNFNEKKSVLDYLEKKIRKEGRERVAMVQSVQEFFNLTDKEMNTVKGNRKDYRFMTDSEFDTFMKGLQGKAYSVEQHKNAVLEVEHTIFEMELRKVDNLRRALKMKDLENMSIMELQKFNNLLQTYQQGDEFLGKRRIQTATLTDLGNITTSREAKEKLAKEAGVSIEELNSVSVKEIDQFLYDPAFARKNPLYKVMVDNVNRATVIAGQRFDEVRKDIQGLLVAARKSRPRRLGDKLVPTDQMIFDYLSATSEEKIKLAQDMTKEEIEAALYIQQKYSEIRDYLIKQGTLTKYRQNYVTHVRRSFLEALKEGGLSVFTIKGFKGLVKELFDSTKQEKAAFNILDEKTGEVLALEKFFRFSMQRSDDLIPSKNVGKAFLEYVRTFEKKRQLDSFVPKLDIFTHVLTPQKTTKKGIIKDDTLNTFVKKWLNNKKGRVDKLLFAPGSRADTVMRAGIAMIRVLDLGLNIPVGLASNFGAQGSTLIPLGIKKYALGQTRKLTKQGKAILAKNESLVGETFWNRMQDASKNIGDKVNESLFGLFSTADRNAKAVFLLGKLTPEEFKTGKISSERLAEIRSDMGRWHIMDNMESIVGKTAIGKVFTQYKKWAVPLIHTTIDNLSVVTKSLKNKENPLKLQEGKELLRSTILTALVLVLGYKAYDELKRKKSRTFLENLAFKSMNDSLSVIGALSPTLWTSNPRLIQWIGDLSASLTIIIKSLVTGQGTETEDVAGVRQLKKTILPHMLRPSAEDQKQDLTSVIKTSARTAEKSLEELDSNVIDPAKKTWEEVKKVGVGTEDADTIVSDLSDEEYKAYKLVKTSDTKYQLDQAEKIKKVVEQAHELGFGTEKADELVADLSDPDYEMYKKVKKILYQPSDTGAVAEWDKLSFIEKAGNLIQGWTTDPKTAFDNLIHGGEYKITELRNGQIIVERMPENVSEAIKKKVAKDNAQYKLDHIVPLKSGGTNRSSNLEIVPTEIWAETTDIENYLSKALKDKRITGKQAREYIIRYKATQDRELTPQIKKEYEDKYNSEPITFEQIKDLVSQ